MHHYAPEYSNSITVIDCVLSCVKKKERNIIGSTYLTINSEDKLQGQLCLVTVQLQLLIKAGKNQTSYTERLKQGHRQ